MEAIILAGGLGTRLRSICPALPKPLAPIQGKPFLSRLMHYWTNQGINHFILAVGYLHKKILSYYGNHFQDVPITYSIEKKLLGTGGALLQALSYLQHPEHPFLALNGDTYFEVPLSEFTLKGSCTLAVYPTLENARYDGISLAENGQLMKFGDPHSSLINGGCYLFHADVLRPFPPKRCSLENELLPSFVNKGTCFGKLYLNSFIDIGIPEDYIRCQTLFPPQYRG